MKRLKNYGLWVAIAALLFMILQEFGVSITHEKYQIYVDLLLSILIMLGIINNPTTKSKGFGDDK